MSRLSSENSGIADQAMLEAVGEEVRSDTVRLINDKVVVETAVSQVVAVAADIWLLPEAPLTVVDSLEHSLREAWSAEMWISTSTSPGSKIAAGIPRGSDEVKVTSPATWSQSEYRDRARHRHPDQQGPGIAVRRDLLPRNATATEKALSAALDRLP